MWQKFKRKLARYYFILRPTSAIFFGVLIIFFVFKVTPFVIKGVSNFFSFPSMILQIFFDRSIDLKKANHRINFLILGVPGGNHEGAQLTDTMIFASVDPEKKDILLISIPRDIWVDSLKAKINTAYFYGEEKKEGGGFILAKAAVSEIFDQPVDYVIKLDFSGFKKAIDLLGGIEVEVERSFTDEKYPIEGKENDDCGGEDPEYKCRYQTIHFEKGKQHMDGETALRFVRSRHAKGKEGTDFARGKRQQKVILAVKDKVFSLGTLLNPKKIKGLIDIFGESIETDIKKDEIDDFIKLAKNLSHAKIRSFNLDVGDAENGKPGLLVNPPQEDYDGLWVLVPRSGDWGEIQEKIEKELGKN